MTYEKIMAIFEKYDSSKTVLLSLLLLFFLFVVKKITAMNIRKKDLTDSEKLFLEKKAGQYSNYLFVIMLLVLWFSQLQAVFVSLIAVAAAIVIAFKELIMCITGGIYLQNNKLFKEGHQIEVNGIRGIVLKRLFLSTKVLELGPETNSNQTTGDVIGIPNSIFLAHSVKNGTFFRGYSIKSFEFSLPIADNLNSLEDLEKLLVSKAAEISAPYLADAEIEISQFYMKEGLALPHFEPRARVVLKDHQTIVLLIKFPVYHSKLSEIEQELTRSVLAWLKNNKVTV